MTSMSCNKQVPAGSVSAHEAVVAGVVDVAMEPAAAAAIHGDPSEKGFSLLCRLSIDRLVLYQQDRAGGQFNSSPNKNPS